MTTYTCAICKKPADYSNKDVTLQRVGTGCSIFHDRCHREYLERIDRLWSVLRLPSEEFEAWLKDKEEYDPPAAMEFSQNTHWEEG